MSRCSESFEEVSRTCYVMRLFGVSRFFTPPALKVTELGFE